MTELEPRCADCARWDSRDSLAGFCQEITDHLRQDPLLAVHGLATCRTAASGHCARFDPSRQALDEYEAEAAHQGNMRRAAGRDYPASLR
jgi:hypothetical protein